MLTVEQAVREVLERARPLPCASVPLDDALGCVLAQDITSDVDSPPHDKSMVDGYAIRTEDFVAGTRQWEVVEEILAGRIPSRPVGPGTTTRIMTGAPIPAGADAVVMVEQSEPLAAAPRPQVALRPSNVVVGQNIMRRGQSLRQGALVLTRGAEIRAAEIGLLAEVGRAVVPVVGRPTVAILSTGDELVPVDERPGPGQIRNSNGPMLAALVRQVGGTPRNMGIVRDTPADLTRAIDEGLAADVLVLSGGVSAGVADLVPGHLAAAGVQQVFHKVQLRPGKPLWFGVAPRERSGEPDRLVFGLPGNPVSSLVCFELFVRPALARLAGRNASTAVRGRGRLAAPFQHRGDRPTYYPAFVERTTPSLGSVPEAITASGACDGRDLGDSAATCRLLNWQGSADLATLVHANALAAFPAGTHQYAAGDEVELVWLGGAT